ncbi:MAG TPA: Lrp/AsnC family transcriptional regulator [Nitrolancea sp.]|nr:Lrp/AsnC family transcriptional regulator [Nitrolancea sp.]
MATERRDNPVFAYDPPEGMLDEINQRLLAELQREPRLTMAALGRRVGLSSPAVTERVRRLEESGVIVGYRLEVSAPALGLPLAAYVRVRPHAGQLNAIAELARKIPEVVECHRVTGDDCFIMKVHIPEMKQLDNLLDRFLIYGNTTTSIIQSSPVPLRSLPVIRENQ